MSELVTLPVVDCWNSIGVKGDRSCPKLSDAIHCHNCDVFADAARAFLDRPAPLDYLAEVTDSLTRNPELKSAQAVSVVLFEVGEQLFAIDTKAVVEVTSPCRPHRVSHRNGRIFSGIVNIHGQLELCCSLSGLLHIEARGTAGAKSSARMLLVEHDGLRWSFDVDRVHGVHRFEPLDVTPIPATSQQDAASYMQNVLRFGDRRAGQLDLAKTFRALESSLR